MRRQVAFLSRTFQHSLDTGQCREYEEMDNGEGKTTQSRAGHHMTATGKEQTTKNRGAELTSRGLEDQTLCPQSTATGGSVNLAFEE
jgi:hypothetical protein